MGFPDADYSGRYRLSDGLDVPLFRPSRQRADGCSARSLRSGKSPAVRAPRSVDRIGTQRKDQATPPIDHGFRLGHRVGGHHSGRDVACRSALALARRLSRRCRGWHSRQDQGDGSGFAFSLYRTQHVLRTGAFGLGGILLALVCFRKFEASDLARRRDSLVERGIHGPSRPYRGRILRMVLTPDLYAPPIRGDRGSWVGVALAPYRLLVRPVDQSSLRRRRHLFHWLSTEFPGARIALDDRSGIQSQSRTHRMARAGLTHGTPPEELGLDHVALSAQRGQSNTVHRPSE